MKVAVITWFSYNNYGTALQVYALTKYLESRGHDVGVIQYYPRNLAVDERKTPIVYELASKSIQKIKSTFDPVIIDKLCDKLFEDFIWSSLKFTNVCESQADLENLNGKYDAFICGSDQIWSQLCFDPHYFLDFVSDKRRTIAYAPSMGVSHYLNETYKKRIASLVNNISYISVRETTGQQLLQSITSRNISYVVDPTLLFDSSDWRKYLCLDDNVIHENYLVAFFLGDNEEYWKTVQHLAIRVHLKVYIIPCHKSDLSRRGVICQNVGPKEFVKIISEAQLVCSDSFHALAFAITFNREVYAFKRFKDSSKENQNSRVMDLFTKLGIDSHININRDNLPERIDYQTVNDILQKDRAKSFEFINDSLEEINHLPKVSTKNNIREKHSLCCGCGACYTVCPTNAISMSLNSDGFYQSFIDDNKCISCGKCVRVCPFADDTESVDIMQGKLYAYKDSPDILRNSSSGGAAYRLAQKLNTDGYAIAACSFNGNSNEAEHIFITSNDNIKLSKLQGSKYIQSKFWYVIDDIKNQSGPVAIFGTPCQIAASRKLFHSRNDIYYIDIVCHGIPSRLMYLKYIHLLEQNYHLNLQNSISVSFRDKSSGWHNKSIMVTDGNQKYVSTSSKDVFQQMFNSGICYCSSCYECRWRSKSAADVRLGDYWGNRYSKDKTGISMIVSLTSEGNDLIRILRDVSNRQLFVKTQIDDYPKAQQININQRPIFYYDVMCALHKKENNIKEISDRYALPIIRYDRAYVSITSMLRKFANHKDTN